MIGCAVGQCYIVSMGKYELSDLVDLTDVQRSVVEMVEKDDLLAKTFFLTGGTLLKARSIVPRESNDLDFFTFASVDGRVYVAALRAMKQKLQEMYSVEVIRVTDKGFLHEPSGMMIDAVADAVPNIEEFAAFGALKTASLPDMAAHKASALCSRDEIKDYIDMAFLTKNENWSLKDLEDLAERKFGLGTISEEKLLTELIAKRDIFAVRPDLFLRDGGENVKVVQIQIAKLIAGATL